MKEKLIRDYIAKINFKKDWNYKLIEEDMRRLLGERPSIEAIYVKDVMLNEVTGDAKEIKRLEKISVTFTETTDKYKQIDINID